MLVMFEFDVASLVLVQDIECSSLVVLSKGLGACHALAIGKQRRVNLILLLGSHALNHRHSHKTTLVVPRSARSKAKRLKGNTLYKIEPLASGHRIASSSQQQPPKTSRASAMRGWNPANSS